VRHHARHERRLSRRRHRGLRRPAKAEVMSAYKRADRVNALSAARARTIISESCVTRDRVRDGDRRRGHGDLRRAKVHVSVLGDEEQCASTMTRSTRHAVPRHELGAARTCATCPTSRSSPTRPRNVRAHLDAAARGAGARGPLMKELVDDAARRARPRDRVAPRSRPGHDRSASRSGLGARIARQAVTLHCRRPGAGRARASYVGASATRPSRRRATSDLIVTVDFGTSRARSPLPDEPDA
jgi:hypothetical protein